LNERARSQLEAADALVMSAVSVWEIEIKRARGRLAVPLDIADRSLEEGLDPLTITIEHALEAGRLPLHHRDPFDRMLIAQARSEGLTLATADATLGVYDVPLLTVSRR
jgi:PIN domain nuclease of toxin-antitoxin system